MFSGPWQIVLLLVVIVLVFGSKKLPELAHSLGKSLNEFKKGKEEGEKPAAAVPPPAPQVTQQPTAAASVSNETVTPEVVK